MFTFGQSLTEWRSEMARKTLTKKERAARNRRSLNKETVVILEMALSDARAMEGPELPTPHRGHFLLTDEWIDQAKREGRP
jgi:hypothetical protein